LLVGGILPSVVDDEALGEWCHQHLEDGLGAVLFRSGHLSEVVGAQLTSGRQDAALRLAQEAQRSGPA
jgi:hypothetical protein